MSAELVDDPLLGDEESLFSRDIDGRLVRIDKATKDQLDQDVTVVIDGRVIRVKRAVVARDAQGKLRYDEEGRAIPRATTIYDAALALADAVPDLDVRGRQLKDDQGRAIFRPRTESEPRPAGAEAAHNPIPTLCHQFHLDPVAVCRVCVVEISRVKRGERRTERKLLPACQHRVEDTMEVRTIATSRKVESSVKTVVELLLADHPTPCAKEQQSPGNCELESLAARLGIGKARFPSRPPFKVDDSSLLIGVDHNACIMCDRCVRGCNDLRDNQVIGRMLKGYNARIAFDLDEPMGRSSCVSCGECMVSCPTGALTFRNIIDSKVFENVDPPANVIDVADLLEGAHPEIRRAFANVSPTFLEWNAKAIVRRRFAPGQIICRQGEYGATAFFIEEGTVDIYIEAFRAPLVKESRGGLFGLFRRRSQGDRGRTILPSRRFIPVDADVVLPLDKPRVTRGVGDLLGEMACLNSYPRSATLCAGDEGCTVLEMQRNVLDIMRRSQTFREEMDRRYRERVINVVLASIPIFSGLDHEFIEELSQRAIYRRFEPGEVILRQGEVAVGGRSDGSFFLVRSGFVKIAREHPGGEVVLNYRGPGNYIGEIGLLSSLTVDDFGAEWNELEPLLSEMHRLSEPGFRVATCSALDHVELVQIGLDDFRRIFKKASPDVRRGVIAEALERMKQAIPLRPARQQEDEEDWSRRFSEGFSPRSIQLREFLDQGLMGAMSLLVLDLTKCTRCDECTKACSDTHGGVTRLIREGLRFDKYLVASSCRSCHDPVCLVGCPVDAIHRRPGSNEIWIEDTCIGCGKCAENCPYGNINMHELESPQKGRDPASPESRIAVVRRATTCDQCKSLEGHQPNCVVACPHDAAHRMEGHDLFKLVQEATKF